MLCLVIRTSYHVIPQPHTRILNRISKDRQTRTLKRTWPDHHARISHEDPGRTFLPMHSILKIWMQGPRQEGFNRISTTAFDKNLYKIMQGPLRGIHQDLYKSFSQGLHKRSWNLEAGPCTPELRPTFCVSLRNRNAHFVMLTCEPFYARSYNKNAGARWSTLM